MDFSKIKLVISDMDGTLLNANHEVSKDFFNIYRVLKSKGILFVAASGRSHKSISKKLDAIKEDIIIVSENGAIAIKQDQLILSTPLLDSHFKKVVQLISNLEDTFPVYCGMHQIYIKRINPEFKKLLKEYYPAYLVIEDENEIKEPIYKIALYHNESSERFIYPHVKHLEGDFKVKVSANHWVDISELLAHKGHAIQLIQKTYNILPEETMAFGDYKNDIEMLRLAQFSYAMANAHPEVIEAANYMTLSHTKQGVEHILKQLIK